VGLLPAWQTIDAAAARRVRAAGFRGASIIIPRPLEAEEADLRRLKAALDAADLEVAQANGMFEALVNPDEAARALGVRGLRKMIEIGRFLNAETVFVRPGSLHQESHWHPHPENHSAQTFDRLVDSLRQAAATAEAEGMTLALEGHVVCPVDSPQRMRDTLAAVGSRALKFNLDIVNFCGTVADAHDPTRVTEELFALLAGEIAVAHVKDVAIENKHVVHIEEVLLGQGTLDFQLMLKRLEEHCPEVYCLIEHLPDELIPAARAHFWGEVVRAGVRMEV
jgi:sugar phosphate isomerase/epimerase